MLKANQKIDRLQKREKKKKSKKRKKEKALHQMERNIFMGKN